MDRLFFTSHLSILCQVKKIRSLVLGILFSNTFIFFICINSLNAQCGGLSANQGFADASSSSGGFGSTLICGDNTAAWIGVDNIASSSVTWTIPGGTSYFEVDVSGISNTASSKEYIRVIVNGMFMDLNSVNAVLTPIAPGCTSSSPLLSITTPSSLGYAGVSGVIINDDGTNKTNVLEVDLGSCIANTITIENVIPQGTPWGSGVRMRYCTDPCEVDTDGDGITDDNEAAGEENDPCLPVQTAGYTGYDAGNAIWAAADCDGDGITNGAEDGISDPYDVCDNSHTVMDICMLCNTNNGTNQGLALCMADCDAGGANNAIECDAGTDPTNVTDDPSCNAGSDAPNFGN